MDMTASITSQLHAIHVQNPHHDMSVADLECFMQPFKHFPLRLVCIDSKTFVILYSSKFLRAKNFREIEMNTIHGNFWVCLLDQRKILSGKAEKAES